MVSLTYYIVIQCTIFKIQNHLLTCQGHKDENFWIIVYDLNLFNDPSLPRSYICTADAQVGVGVSVHKAFLSKYVSA